MRIHHRHTSFHHTIHNFCTCTCMHTSAFDNHNAQTRHVKNKVKYVTTPTGTSQHNDDHRTRHHVIIISSSKIIIANQSSSPPPSPQTASKPAFFHHHNHNRHHHNFQETLVTSRQRKHQRGKKNAAYQCQTKPIETKIQFNKIKHAPHQNFTHHFTKPLQRNRNRNRSQVEQRNTIAIREQYAQQQQEKKLESNAKSTSKIKIECTNHNKQSLHQNNRKNQTSTAAPSILILFTIIEFVIKQIKCDCNSQYCL